MIKGLPMKRGFTNIFKDQYTLVTLDTLDTYDTGSTINSEILREGGHIKGPNKMIKIVATGHISKAVTISAHKFTKVARERIEQAGGTAEETN